MDHFRFFLIAVIVLAVMVVALVWVGLTFYHSSKIIAPYTEGPITPPRAKFVGGKTAFFYPAGWNINDIPAAEGFISVQLMDPEDPIVFVASSNPKGSDSVVRGRLMYEKELTLDKVKGREREWDDDSTGTVVYRADNFNFGDRSYRFEMFTTLSRKAKAERVWLDILTSVRFDREGQGIEASPQEEN